MGVVEHDITKLPKWTQELIAGLEERAKHWEEEANEYRHAAYDAEERLEREWEDQAGANL